MLYLYLNTQISVFVFVFENPGDEIFVFVFGWRIWVYLANIFQDHFMLSNILQAKNAYLHRQNVSKQGYLE